MIPVRGDPLSSARHIPPQHPLWPARRTAKISAAALTGVLSAGLSRPEHVVAMLTAHTLTGAELPRLTGKVITITDKIAPTGNRAMASARPHHSNSCGSSSDVIRLANTP
jgi:hypothetical protein